MKISFAEFDLPQSGAVVVGVWEDRVLTAAGPAARRGDRRRGRPRARRRAPLPAARRTSCCRSSAPAELPLSRIVLAGLGKPDAVDARLLQDLGGNLVAHLNGAGESEATFAHRCSATRAPIEPAEAAAQLAFGAQLRVLSLRQIPHQARSPSRSRRSPRSPWRPTAPGAARSALSRRSTRPPRRSPSPAIWSPSRPTCSIPRRWPSRPRRSRELGVAVEILDENRMRELGMGALLGGRRRAAPGRRASSSWSMARRHAAEQPRRSPLSARASPSTPAASRSSRPPAWAT